MDQSILESSSEWTLDSRVAPQGKSLKLGQRKPLPGPLRILFSHLSVTISFQSTKDKIAMTCKSFPSLKTRGTA